MTHRPANEPRSASAARWPLLVLALAIPAAVFGGWEIFERAYLAGNVDMETIHVLHTVRGVAASLLLAGTIAWYLLSGRLPLFPVASRTEEFPKLIDRQARLRRHVIWFVQMRWVAAGFSLALIVIAVRVASILPTSTLMPLLIWWSLLVAANVAFRAWARRGRDAGRQIMVQAATDLVVLTGFLNASGGIENPLYIAYVFHIMIVGILLPSRKAFALTALAASLFLFLAFGEYFRIIPHRTNVLFPHGHAHLEVEPTPAADVASEERDAPNVRPAADEMALHTHADGSHHLHVPEGPSLAARPAEAAGGLSGDTAAVPVPSGGLEAIAEFEGTAHASHNLLFVLGRGLPFLVVLALIGYLTSAFAERLRASENDLERAARTAMLEHERLEGVVDASRVGMMLVTPDAEILWFNGRIPGLVGFEQDALGGRCPLNRSTGGCSRCIVEETARTGKPVETERASGTDLGAIRHFRHSSSPVRDAAGNIVQVVELIEEITSRKALEAEALHAGKLAVLGRMAAGIAHEIGNPLSSLTTRLHLMEKRNDPEFLGKSIELIREQIGRIGRIVRGISHFARRDRESWAVWDLNGVVEETIGVVQLHKNAKNVSFRKHLEEPSPRVRGVRDQISQVALNLVLNAVEVMIDGGLVEISTFRTGDQTVLAVRDTGPGMDDHTVDRLFEPFFTTKPDGTGLGLSVSYSLVHAHGGRIRVETRPGEGSRFTVLLPQGETPVGARNEAAGS